MEENRSNENPITVSVKQKNNRKLMDVIALKCLGDQKAAALTARPLERDEKLKDKKNQKN